MLFPSWSIILLFLVVSYLLDWCLRLKENDMSTWLYVHVIHEFIDIRLSCVLS